eukprot:m.358335 g.358335  ORF g.358335 m.358335 type:complete len:507 (+) comp18115_c0_seq1:224-1744(+)
MTYEERQKQRTSTMSEIEMTTHLITSEDGTVDSALTDSDTTWVDGESSTDDDTDHHAVSPQLTWIVTAATIVSNMIGVGVLGLPSAFHSLGYIGACLILVLFTLLSMYSGLIIGWMRGDNLQVTTYPDLAFHIMARFGQRTATICKRVVQVLLFTYLQGVCTLYLLTLKLSMEQMMRRCETAPVVTTLAPTTTTTTTTIDRSGIHDNRVLQCDSQACSDHGFASLPDAVWLIIAAVLVFPFVHFRSLAQARWLSWVGVLTILIVNIFIVARSVEHRIDAGPPPTDHADSLQGIVNAVTTVAFAFGGHAVLVDVMSEMQTPDNYPKAIYTSQIFMLFNYALVGFTGMLSFGASIQSTVMLNMPRDKVTTAASAILIVHVAVAYCISSTILVKNVFKAVWPTLYAHKGQRQEKAVRWGFIATLVLLFAFTIAVVVPYFGDIMDVYSAIGVFSLSFWVPASLLIFYVNDSMQFGIRIVNVMILAASALLMFIGIWASTKDAVARFRTCL